MKKTQDLVNQGVREKSAFEARVAHLERLSARALTAAKWIIFVVSLIGCVAIVASYSRIKKAEAQLERVQAAQDSLAHRHGF